MRYVISDLHGHYKLFKQMLETINYKPEDTLYILGDMIDRGEEPIELVQYIMKQPNMKVLLGNHENLMLNVLADPEDEKALALWNRNGGEVTYEQYKGLSEREQEELSNFLLELPLFIELEDYLLVHAGIRVEEEGLTWKDVCDKQIRRDFIWMRDEFIQHPTIVDKKIIFGHTQTFRFDKPGVIWFGEDKIGIDCGVYSQDEGGRLGCLNIDTFERFYLEA